MSDKEKQPVLGRNAGRSLHTFLSRNGCTNLGVLTVTALGIALVIFGIKIISGSPVRQSTNERSEKMFVTKQESVASHELQPVGTSMLAKTEIATFALG